MPRPHSHSGTLPGEEQVDATRRGAGRAAGRGLREGPAGPWTPAAHFAQESRGGLRGSWHGGGDRLRVGPSGLQGPAGRLTSAIGLDGTWRSLSSRLVTEEETSCRPPAPAGSGPAERPRGVAWPPGAPRGLRFAQVSRGFEFAMARLVRTSAWRTPSRPLEGAALRSLSLAGGAVALAARGWGGDFSAAGRATAVPVAEGTRLERAERGGRCRGPDGHALPLQP